MKILFQGDSITDAGRDRQNMHDLGKGYPLYAAEYIRRANPGGTFEFIDLGISGNQTKDLVDRLQTDFIDIQPDIVSILIGVNDTWHHAEDRSWIPDAIFEERYRKVLTGIKQHTKAKIMMLEPFLIPAADKQFFREDLDPKIQIIRRLAREFADVYLPTDGLLAAAYIGEDPLSFAEDGVHPTQKGAQLIGSLYAQYIQPLLSGQSS